MCKHILEIRTGVLWHIHTKLIGASLSEPHTSESNSGYYISAIRRSVNAS